MHRLNTNNQKVTIMKNCLSIGLSLAVMAFLWVSCTQEGVLSETSQVTNHQVSFRFFETSMSDIASSYGTDASTSARQNAHLTTRADEGTPLQDCHTFSELEVALIPIANTTDSGYVVRQDSLDEDFGKVSLDVPAGDYHLVVVAAKTQMPFADHIKIKSNTEVRFPKDEPTDMVYAYKDITVSAEKSKQTFDATLKRGVSAFRLSATDYAPLNVAAERIELTGGCGNVFNPSTGKCKDETTVLREISFDAQKVQDYRLYFTVYTFLNDTYVNNVSITTQSKDKDGTVLKELRFSDVHLALSKMTTYKGAVFTSDNSASFTVAAPKWIDSGYSKDF